MQTEMEMVEVETSTLIYKALDWAVAYVASKLGDTVDVPEELQP